MIKKKKTTAKEPASFRSFPLGVDAIQTPLQGNSFEINSPIVISALGESIVCEEDKRLWEGVNMDCCRRLSHIKPDEETTLDEGTEDCNDSSSLWDCSLNRFSFFVLFLLGGGGGGGKGEGNVGIFLLSFCMSIMCVCVCCGIHFTFGADQVISALESKTKKQM